MVYSYNLLYIMWFALTILLYFKVMELDLLSLDSVVRFAEAWNARLGPLHVLINNAGIFSIGGSGLVLCFLVACY